MKQKHVLTGILGFALVFGFGLVLTLASCGEQTTEITVTNDSSFANDDPVTVRIHVPGRGDPLATQNCSKNQSVTFSLDAGDYSIRVTGGGGSFYYPKDSSAMKMSGSIKLKFNGNSVTRTN